MLASTTHGMACTQNAEAMCSASRDYCSIIVVQGAQASKGHLHTFAINSALHVCHQMMGKTCTAWLFVRLNPCLVLIFNSHPRLRVGQSLSKALSSAAECWHSALTLAGSRS